MVARPARLAQALLALAILLTAARAVASSSMGRLERLTGGGWTRVLRELASEDAERDAWEDALGEDAAAFALVRERVPPEGIVVVRLEEGATQARENRCLAAARCLLFPRQFYSEAMLRDALARGPVPLSSNVYLLDRRVGEPFEGVGPWEDVVVGAGVVLRRWSGTGE